MAIQVYQDSSADDFADALRGMSKISAGGVFRFPEGSTLVRAIPLARGSQDKLVLAYGQHFVKKPGEEKATAIACARSFGQPCQVCDLISLLLASRQPAAIRAAEEYKVTAKALWNVLVRGEEDAGAQTADIGRQILKDLQQIRASKSSGGNFTDPHNGFDIEVVKTGSGMATRYSAAAVRQSSRLAETDEEIQMLIENQPDKSSLIDMSIPEWFEDLCERMRNPHTTVHGGARLSGGAAVQAAPRVGFSRPTAAQAPVVISDEDL
jgi:hypothetical protein